jgi:hypothetical protein
VGHTPNSGGNTIFGSFKSVTIAFSSSTEATRVSSCSQHGVYHQPIWIFSQFAAASFLVMMWDYCTV